MPDPVADSKGIRAGNADHRNGTAYGSGRSGNGINSIHKNKNLFFSFQQKEYTAFYRKSQQETLLFSSFSQDHLWNIAGNAV